MITEEQRAFVESVDLATRQKDSAPMWTASYDAKHYFNDKLGEGEKERTARIRILPISPEGGSFYVYVPVHRIPIEFGQDRKQWKTFMCLNNTTAPWHKADIKCPLCEKAEKMFAEARGITDEETRKQHNREAASYKTRGAYILRVIDRDHEEDGPKFWRFFADSRGEGCYDKLMAVYRNRRNDKKVEEGIDDYNVFDIYNGRDIILQLSRAQVGKNPFATNIKMSDSSTEKPLSQDAEQIATWINNPLKWYDVYGVKPREFLRVAGLGLNPVLDEETHTYVPFGSSSQSNNTPIAAPDEPTITVRQRQPATAQPQTTVQTPTPQPTKQPNISVAPAEEDELPF